MSLTEGVRAIVRTRPLTAIGALGAALLLAVLLALLLGPYPIGPGTLVELLFRRLTGTTTDALATADTVLFNIRLPRIMAAILVGGALALAGAAYQGLFRNPLVSPDILGVSAGASLGAVLGIFLSLPVTLIQILAFGTGLGAVAIVYAIGSAVRTHDPVLTLVLAGVVLGALTGALVSLIKVLADPYDQLPAITFWLLGSLASIKTADLVAAAPAALLGLVPLVLMRWRLNVMALGDEEAQSLGIDVRRTRMILIAGATLATAGVVAIAGVVGWIGLIVPHMVRMIVGPDFTRVVPASMLLGATFLLLVDTLARTLTTSEVPIGILTALLGAPFFLWLLAKGGRPWG